MNPSTIFSPERIASGCLGNVEINERAPALKPTDYEAIVQCLEQALAVFDRRSGILNVTELRTKSILTTLRADLLHRMQESRPPFEG